ncbi:MAG: hypothetical protein WCK51_03900 [Armatimonadota bacterium]
MKRFGILGGLALSLSGCHQAAPIVYVDLDRVPLDNAKSIESMGLPAGFQTSKVGKTLSIESRPERIIRADRDHSAAAIKSLLEVESAGARKTISERLKQYYQTEIDEFFDKEYENLGPEAQRAWQGYRNQVRPIFERYAKERGPLVVALTVLTEFPNPEALVKIDLDADPAIQARTERIREMQRQIALLDRNYDLEIEKLDGRTRLTIQDREQAMNDRVESKRKEINDRAEQEAKQQVNVRTDVLNERLVSMGAVRLRSAKGESASVELGAAQSGVKGVPSTSRQIVPPADAHRQLQMWLALNGYDLADSPVGVRDATQDFIKWRTSLTSKR